MKSKREVSYKIIDLDELTSRRQDARRHSIIAHEGRLLRFASSGPVTATRHSNAVGRYMRRVQGGHDVLPRGRFVAIPVVQWERMTQIETLPKHCGRTSLLTALHEYDQRLRNSAATPKREPAPAVRQAPKRQQLALF